MFENQDKKKLYWLIDQYLSNKMSARDFCSNYHVCYDVELDLNSITTLEKQLFSELSIIAGRFSPYDQDHKNFPNVFYTENELKQKIIDVKKKLCEQWPTVVSSLQHDFVEWVKFKKINDGFYCCTDASSAEMRVLGLFLSTDIGCHNFDYKESAQTKKSEYSHTSSLNQNGDLIALIEDNGGYIHLTDKYSEEQKPASFKVAKEYFIKILDDWQKYVCHKAPQEIRLLYKNDEFIFETT
jgi:hypothetical protein